MSSQTKPIERSEGPHVVGGKLFFKILDGSSISCECIGDPYATQVVNLFETMIERAIKDVEPDMSESKTTPTTEYCIEWLWHDKEEPWSPASVVKAETIRAKLLAAEEMAKALGNLAGPRFQKMYGDWSEYKNAQQAISAWRKAGGGE